MKFQSKCSICGQNLTDASGNWDISHYDHGIWHYEPKRISVCASCEDEAWDYLITLAKYKNDVDYRKIAEGNIKILKRHQTLVLDEIYRSLKKEQYVMDALAYITDDFDYKKELDEYTQEQRFLADAIAERLVYDGEYDSGLSLWNNIKKIYDEISTADTDPEDINSYSLSTEESIM